MSATATTASRPVRSPLAEAWHRFRRDRVSVFFLAVFLSYGVIALGAQVVELLQGSPFTYEMTLAELGYPLPETANPPSLLTPLNWLGTESAGKSVLLRVFHGTKVAFVVGIAAAGLAAMIGTTMGLIAGFFGKWVDEIVVYIYSTLASIPFLLLLLALAFVIRSPTVAGGYEGLHWGETYLKDYVSLGLFTIVFVIGTTSWITLCRLVRAETKKVRELDYVAAARAMGFGNVRIMFRHVLPNVFHLVIINFSLTFVTAIKSEVILTFLGLGVDKEPSWGQLIAGAKSELMRGVWWPLAAAGIALFVLTLSINYVGDALRDALDPKLRD